MLRQKKLLENAHAKRPTSRVGSAETVVQHDRHVIRSEGITIA
jgi:hypothetical protein